MPRTRRNSKTAARKTRATAKSQTGAKRMPSSRAFVCPECGKTFTRAAALGSHRRRAHGVLGATALAKTTSRQASSGSAANGRGGRGATRTGSSAGSPRRTRGSAMAPTGSTSRVARGTDSVDRDALLQTLFPNGIPARESLIRELNSWLDQAEQLAQRS
jgi:hypothetical protein